MIFCLGRVMRDVFPDTHLINESLWILLTVLQLNPLHLSLLWSIMPILKLVKYID